MDGEHRVIVKFAGQEVPLSPFRVNIEGPAADPSKVISSGPGVDRSAKNCVGRRTHFTVNTQSKSSFLQFNELGNNGKRESLSNFIQFSFEYTSRNRS